ncbi:hypothetical protein HD597_000685 [Nonomuraea thailandensis]|uniref:Mycothiol-dependent maleylpyruvate isomerase metal-binding domain-containing protein n=1 Tax=Nonomuraea thailandensis TaxID=1188745 RepID=A0A9X2JZE3_9ACTN|nr:hypothetical protein [Nonomuraea thailandensis]MCP2353665.1 hypothetical protein [Nonomuraea thailandensis]
MIIPWSELPIASAAEALPVLEKGVDQDWSRRAADTSWTARDLLDHIVLGVVGYAALLIARPADRYTSLWASNDPHAPIQLRIESIDIAAHLLSLTVRGTAPGVRAFHPWGTSDASGFTAMAALEILVHSHDLARTLGYGWSPPDVLAAQVVERLFPNAPKGHAPGQTLLWCTGRIALPGVPQLPREQWQWYGEVRD